jgi:hypothetical protein
MSTIGFDTSVLNKLTKHVYDTGITDQMIASAPYVKKRRKKPLDLGSDANFSIETGWGEGIGARGDREPLPVPQAPTYLLPTFDAVDEYVVLRITGKEDVRTKNGTRATAEYLKDLLAGSSKNFWRDLEFQAFNDGSGLRASVTTNAVQGAAVTITCANNIPLRGVRQNMTIEFWNDATQQLLGEQVVTSVNRLSGTFVCDLAQDIPAGSNVYVKGNRQREIYGLQYLITDATGPATVLGIATSIYEWNSTLYANGGNTRDLTIQLLDAAYFSSMEQNDQAPSEYWMAYSQMKAWTALVNRNFQVNGSGPGVRVDAHNEIVGFGEAKVNVTSQCAPGQVFVMQGDDVEIRELMPFGPVTEEDAENIWHKIQGYHEFEATFWWSGNQIVKRRNLHSQITDLTIPS